MTKSKGLQVAIKKRLIRMSNRFYLHQLLLLKSSLGPMNRQSTMMFHLFQPWLLVLPLIVHSVKSDHAQLPVRDLEIMGHLSITTPQLQFHETSLKLMFAQRLNRATLCHFEELKASNSHNNLRNSSNRFSMKKLRRSISNNNVPLLPAMLKLEPSKTFGLVDPKAVNYPPIITLIRQRRMKGTTATLKKMTGIKVARMFVDVRLLSQTKTITVVVLPHQLLLLDPQLATVDLVHVDSLRIHGIRIVTTSIMKMMVIGQQLNVTSI